MPEIRILPENVVNQIAAGEVVERASSVLKELVENALDAGASRIQILAKGQGRELLQIADDGCGMSRGDLYLAFERHATSKLAHPDDLWAIRTLGFRGEALPSIASVSFVEVRSRPEGQPSGTMLRIEGGTIQSESPVAIPRGSSISVHSLFFNTPARARFLKSPSTELSHLVKVFKQYALAYPEIAWTFAHDESLEYNLPAAPLTVRLEDLFGHGFSAKTLPLNYEVGGVKVTGVMGKQELNKRSRGDQYLYLNRRPIQSPLIHSAVKAALKEMLEPGEWPFYVVFLEVDPAEVDVNVHPAKIEVKFADEPRVHAAVYRAIRAALPEQLSHDTFTGGAPSPSSPAGGVFTAATATGPVVNAASPEASHEFTLPLTPQAPGDAPRPPDAERHAVAADHLFRPAIFQVHDKYLISQIRSGIAIIDQHAAHERILYERALRSFEERMFNSQQLLFPMLLELSPEEDAVFSDVREDLGDLGFQIRDFGPRTYSIEAVPAGLKRVSEARMIHELIEEYGEFRRADFAPRNALAASFACRAAVKTGDTLSPDEMNALVDELFATQFPLTCPHGRPTVIHIKLSELDRRFKRTE